MKIFEDVLLLGGVEIDSNIYCIANELLVDCGSGVFFNETIDQFKRYGLKLSGIKSIVLTNSNAEHAGGANAFQKKFKAKLFAHPSAQEILNSGETAKELGIDYKAPKVSGALNDGDTIKAGRYTFKVLHTPGYTPDSICLWEESTKMLISGGTLCDPEEGVFPPVDEGMLASSQKRLKELDIQELLPGHGAPASNNNPYGKNVIRDLLSAVE